MKFPWWLSTLLAGIFYIVFKYLLPSLENQYLHEFFQFAPQLAPILAAPFLLLAAKQLYDGAPEKKEDEKREE